MTYFEHLVGNEPIKAYLKRMVDKGSIGNSLLFTGPEGIGKSLFAHELAKMLICKNDPQGIQQHKIDQGNHPDIHIFRPSGKLGLHSMETMRQLTDEVAMPPYEAAWKVFIIQDAERMLPYSANALLKTFEEPTLDSLIILISSQPEALLPTVLSRCRTIYFQPVAEQEILKIVSRQFPQKEEIEVQQWVAQSQGSIARALQLGERGDTRRVLLLDALSQGKMATYKELQKLALEISESTEELKKQIEDFSKQELMQGFQETLSAVQREVVDKEIEGVVSSSYRTEVNAIFAMILGWYRDLHLLNIYNGFSELNAQDLIHRDYQETLIKVWNYHKEASKELLSLEKVQKVIREAQLAIERSTPLSVCLETLLLKLGVV